MYTQSVQLHGIQVYPFDSPDSLLDYLQEYKGILVAINAEKILHATDRTRAIINQNIGYCDGAGVRIALKQKGYPNVCKIAGCELWLKIIERFHKEKSFYLIGSTQTVICQVVDKLQREYDVIHICGYRDGYITTEKEKDALIHDIVIKKPDIIFVAMGSPKQELLMEEISKYHRAIFQGLGGSLDIYAGRIRRASKWWVDHDLEFAYRLMKQPSRIWRQMYLLKFLYWLITKKI